MDAKGANKPTKPASCFLQLKKICSCHLPLAAAHASAASAAALGAAVAAASVLTFAARPRIAAAAHAPAAAPADVVATGGAEGVQMLLMPTHAAPLVPQALGTQACPLWN